MAVHLPEAPYTSEQLIELSQAIQVFERILPGFDVYFDHKSDALAQWTVGKEVNTSVTIRDKVMSATKLKALSVPEIIAQTGLVKRKIWGVLSAPDLVFTKTKTNGETRYQFEKTIPRQNPSLNRLEEDRVKVDGSRKILSEELRDAP